MPRIRPVAAWQEGWAVKELAKSEAEQEREKAMQRRVLYAIDEGNIAAIQRRFADLAQRLDDRNLNAQTRTFVAWLKHLDAFYQAVRVSVLADHSGDDDAPSKENGDP